MAAELLADDPGVVVVLGDADDGGRLLTELDANPASAAVRRFLVNDSIRTATSTIQNLSPSFRVRLTGIAPLATTVREDGPTGFFTAHAVDCVNLIALAAISAESDDPDLFRVRMAPVASGGRACRDFAGCATLLTDENLDINYEGWSGSVELSNSAGDPLPRGVRGVRLRRGRHRDRTPTVRRHPLTSPGPAQRVSSTSAR